MIVARVNGVDVELVNYPYDYIIDSPERRFCVQVKANSTVDEIKDIFVDNAVWRVYDIDDEGHEVLFRDCSDYVMSMDITDHRNDTVTIMMGKLTEMEKMIQTIYGVVN